MAEKYRSMHTGPQIDEGVRRALTFNAIDTSPAAFEIADGDGQVVLRITDMGHLLTKAFNSENYTQILPINDIGQGLTYTDQIVALSDDIFNIQKIYTFGSGLAFSANELSVDGTINSILKIYQLGRGLVLENNILSVDNTVSDITDVRVNGTSVVSDRIANITVPVGLIDTAAGAWEVADSDGNVALRITSTGHLMTKEFNSEDFVNIILIKGIGQGLTFNPANNNIGIADELYNVQRIYSIGNGLALSEQGDLAAILQDVTVDNVSVIDGNVAKIVMPLSPRETSTGALEFADGNGQVALRVTNTGHLQTKLFNSEDLDGFLPIRQIGTGLAYANFQLSMDAAYYNMLKIYEIGNGLTLSSQGALSANVQDVTVNNVSVLDAGIAKVVVPVSVGETQSGAYEVSDNNGNVVLRVTSAGHLQTKEFNSEDLGTMMIIRSVGDGLRYLNGALSVEPAITQILPIYSLGAGLALDENGQLTASVVGGVSDVRVDGSSVVSNTIADITMPVRTSDGSGAFEIADADGNIALQITNEGHIKTKEFDSSDINILPETVNDRYLHTNATTGVLEWSEVEGGENKDFKVVPSLPTPAADSPKVVYNLLDGRLYILAIGGAASSIVGVGMVGYMLVG